MPEEHLSRCQSTNHIKSACWGNIWKCGKCLKEICYEEGSDLDNLCDDCWAERYEKKQAKKQAKLLTSH